MGDDKRSSMTKTLATDEPISILVSPEEKASGKLTPAHLLEAVVAIAEDGLVVLRDAIDPAHLDRVNERMVRDMERLIKMQGTHFNFDTVGNVSQVPPLLPDLIFEDIVANPLAGQVVESMLGPRPQVRYMHGNTAYRVEDGQGEGKRQPVHADLFWRHFHWPFGLVVNVMLVEATPENGSTEIWLGSHRDTTIGDHVILEKDVSHLKMDRETGIVIRDGPIGSALLEARRAIRPPLQPVVPKGALIIRDLRLWHAGMPNHTPDPRCMLAMVHSPAWIDNRVRLTFPRALQKKIESFQSPVVFKVDYVDQDPEEFDYLGLKFNYDPSPWGGRGEDEIKVMQKEWEVKWAGRF